MSKWCIINRALTTEHKSSTNISLDSTLEKKDTTVTSLKRQLFYYESLVSGSGLLACFELLITLRLHKARKNTGHVSHSFDNPLSSGLSSIII